MTESKLDRAQRVLQFFYDFEADPPIAEMEAFVEEKRKKTEQSEIERYGSVMTDFSKADDFTIKFDNEDARAAALVRAAERVNLSAEDLWSAGRWLVERGLLSSPGFSLQPNYRLSKTGEDLIDLGISVEEYYHGPYREALLNRVSSSTNLEDEER